MSELLRPTSVEIEGQTVDINWGEAIAMLGGIDGSGYNYEVAYAADREIGFYHIPAGKTTRVVKIVQEVRCTERLVQGEGWMLVAWANGDVNWWSFDADTGRTSDVCYGLGDTIVWGAGAKEMRALTTSDRPFTEDMEVAVDLDSPELPIGFWSLFRELMKIK